MNGEVLLPAQDWGVVPEQSEGIMRSDGWADTTRVFVGGRGGREGDEKRCTAVLYM